jgi:hypothetical protein
VESKEEWIAAAEAVRLLKPVLGGEYTAQQTICKRAHSSLIRARAERFMVGEVSRNATEAQRTFGGLRGAVLLPKIAPRAISTPGSSAARFTYARSAFRFRGRTSKR